LGVKKKITCQSFLDDMSNYMDGELAGDLRISLEAHLAKCPNCWIVFDETQKTVRVFQDYDCHPLPEDVQGRLMDALHETWNGKESDS